MWSGDQFWQPKAVPPDQFWQTKVVPPRPLLAAKSGPTCQKWPPLQNLLNMHYITVRQLLAAKMGAGSPPSKMTIKVVPLHKEYPLPSKAYICCINVSHNNIETVSPSSIIFVHQQNVYSYSSRTYYHT